MTSRLVTRAVTFLRPFLLDEIEQQLPAGNYQIETEEETLDSVSFIAYRRISTHILVPPLGGGSRGMQMLPIHPASLEGALARDRAGGS